MTHTKNKIQDHTVLPSDSKKKFMFDMISNALLQKGVQLECQSCHHKKFFMFNEFLSYTMAAEDPSQVHCLPLVTVVCYNCGCIIQYSVNTLVPGLIKLADENTKEEIDLLVPDRLHDEEIKNKVDLSGYEEEQKTTTKKNQTKKKYST